METREPENHDMDQFRDRDGEQLLNGQAVRRLPPDIQRTARMPLREWLQPRR